MESSVLSIQTTSVMVVGPGPVNGRVTANASKSAMQRACAAALIRNGVSVLHNPGHSNDDLAALDIITRLGAQVSTGADGSIRIASSGIQPLSGQVHCGESGLSIRMFTPIAACSQMPVSITGEGSLVTRPMNFFDEVLPQLGVRVVSNGGRLPLQIEGPLQPRDLTVDGSLSSQFLTGLMMAYSAQQANDVTLRVTDLKSRPYIDLTLEVMRDFGLRVPVNEDYRRFVFSAEDPTAGVPNVVHYTVEGDWSGAAFLLVAGAVAGGEVEVSGIFNRSRQADKRIVDALLAAGAAVTVGDSSVHVRRSALNGFQFDATDCPDLFPPLVALAAYARGATTIRGLRRLRHKESDRGLTLQEEFAKLNVPVLLEDDTMTVMGNGEVRVLNQKLNSHHDHRIAMAAAVAALQADFDVSIRNADAVNKSYPDFWRHLAQLGGRVSSVQS